MNDKLTLEQLLEIASKPINKEEQKEANLTPVHTFVRQQNIKAGNDFIPASIIWDFYLKNVKGIPLDMPTFFFYLKKLFKFARKWNYNGYYLDGTLFDKKKLSIFHSLHLIRLERYRKSLRKYNALQKYKEKKGLDKVSRVGKKIQQQN